MNKLAQLDTLDRGKGFQYLLNSAYEIIQKPLVIFDTRYSLVARAGEVIDDKIWNALVTTGAHSDETQKFYIEENFFDKLANMDSYYILRSEKLRYARMLGYIFNSEHVKVAVFVMYELGEPFSAQDSFLFKKLSSILTEEIQDDKYYVDYGRAYHEEIIIKLLDGAIKDRIAYTSQIQILYDGFSEYLYVAVVDAANSGEDTDNVKNMLLDKYKAYKFAIYSGYIIMLMSSRYRVAFDELFFDKFYPFFNENNLYAGISKSFENPYDMRENYDKAIAVLLDGKEKNSAHRVFLC